MPSDTAPAMVVLRFLSSAFLIIISQSSPTVLPKCLKIVLKAWSEYIVRRKTPIMSIIGSGTS